MIAWITVSGANSIETFYTALVRWYHDIPSSSIRGITWRHNGCNGVSNHRPLECFLNRLFRRRSDKTSKLRVTGLCAAIHRWPVNAPRKWPVTQKMFHLMTSSWHKTKCIISLRAHCITEYTNKQFHPRWLKTLNLANQWTMIKPPSNCGANSDTCANWIICKKPPRDRRRVLV